MTNPTPSLITDAQARRIAADWADDTCPGLQALATCGAILAAVTSAEITGELLSLTMGGARDPERERQARADLRELRAYVAHNGARGPVASWTQSEAEVAPQVPACPSCGERDCWETAGVEIWSTVEAFTLSENSYGSETVTEVQAASLSGTPALGADDPETGLYGHEGEWSVHCAGCGHGISVDAAPSQEVLARLGTLLVPASARRTARAEIASALGRVEDLRGSDVLDSPDDDLAAIEDSLLTIARALGIDVTVADSPNGELAST